jgi:hypothetical protein
MLVKEEVKKRGHVNSQNCITQNYHYYYNF